MDSRVLDELKKTFVFNQDDGISHPVILLENSNVYGQLNVLFFEHHYERLIFLDQVEEKGDVTLLMLLEHRDYPIRIFVKINLNQNLLPVESFNRWWKNSSYFERRVNESSHREIFVWKETSLCVKNFEIFQNPAHQYYVPPNDLWGGSGCLEYSVKDGVIADLSFRLGLEQRRVENYFNDRPFELYPILIQKNFAKWKNTLTILFYKSIENLLDIKVDPLEISYRMTLLELDRLKEILSILSNVFYEQSLSVLHNLIEELQLELDELLYENSSEQFGFIYPRISGNKFSTYWLQRVDKLLQKTLIAQKKIERALRNNAFFLHPLSEIKLPNINYLNQLDGHLLKANGGARDLRVHYPYYFYQQLDLDVSVGQSLTVADFYFVLQNDLTLVMDTLNLLIAGVPVGTLHSYEKRELFDQFENYIHTNTDEMGLISYTSFDTFQGELGLGWYKIDAGFELRFYRPGSITMAYLLDLFKGIPTENLSMLLPYLSVDLKGLEL